MAASKAYTKLNQSQRDDLLTYLTEDDGSRIAEVCSVLFVGEATAFRAAVGNPITERAAALIERGLQLYAKEREAEEA